MEKQSKQPQPVSHTIQSKTRAANQASVQTVLQKYARIGISNEEGIVSNEELGMRNEEGIMRNEEEIISNEELGISNENSFSTLNPQLSTQSLQGKFESTSNEELEMSNEEGIISNEELGMSNENSEMNNITNSSLLTTNLTGLPDNLKSGIEATSGYSMDAVRVHYNSAKPAQLQALAYTQGTDIHVAPGQEKHLPHEAWHVVQQMQGRVQPTMQLQGVNINDNEGLEKEADVMGGTIQNTKDIIKVKNNFNGITQLTKGKDFKLIINNLIDLNGALGNLTPPLNVTLDLFRLTIRGVTLKMLNDAIREYNGNIYDGIAQNDIVEMYNNSLTNKVNETQIICTYFNHGDKHFNGSGTSFNGKKETVNAKIEAIINGLKGRIRRDANGSNQTYYYKGQGIDECKGVVDKSNKSRKCEDLVIQIDYEYGEEDSITYHGYPDSVNAYCLSRLKNDTTAIAD